MIINLISTQDQIVYLIIFLIVFLTILFLPTLLELKRPKDAGPRIISKINSEEDI